MPSTQRLLMPLRISYGTGTWRRFYYALLAPPIAALGVGLALVGRADAAVRMQRRLVERLVRPAPVGRTGVAYGHTRARLAAHALVGVPVGLATWTLVQYLAWLMLLSVGYPLRNYLDFGGEHHTNALPWDTWSSWPRVRVLHDAHPWASDYYRAWGGPTLAGAWAVHAGLALVVVFPALAWAIRGLVRLQVELVAALLVRGTEPLTVPAVER